MSDYKETIDEVVNQAKKSLNVLILDISTVVDEQGVYDIRLDLSRRLEKYSPEYVSFSYDQDTGYYIDADGITWEFGKDKQMFKATSMRLLTAIRDGKVRLVEKTLFGLMVLRRKLIIDDDSQLKN